MQFDQRYVGESRIPFGECFKEYLKVPSPMHGHQSTIGHPTSLENFIIIGRYDKILTIHIRDGKEYWHIPSTTQLGSSNNTFS